MTEEIKKKHTLIEIIYKLFWWCMIIVYTYAYLTCMPHSSFGVSQFSELLFYMPLICGWYVLLKTGGLAK
jgi:hypothetical protein